MSKIECGSTPVGYERAVPRPPWYKGRSEVGLSFPTYCMTRRAAERAGLAWLDRWGATHDQDTVHVSYYDAAGMYQAIVVTNREPWWWRLIYSLRWAGTVWGAGQVRS